MKRPRLRLTVGLMMILVAALAIATWAVQYSRRTRLIFDNRSASRIRDVTVTHAGWVRHLGPVEPHGKLEWRIMSPPEEMIRIGYDVQGRPGEKDLHVSGPGLSALEPGQVIQVGWGGDYGP